MQWLACPLSGSIGSSPPFAVTYPAGSARFAVTDLACCAVADPSPSRCACSDPAIVQSLIRPAEQSLTQPAGYSLIRPTVERRPGLLQEGRAMLLAVPLAVLGLAAGRAGRSTGHAVCRAAGRAALVVPLAGPAVPLAMLFAVPLAGPLACHLPGWASLWPHSQATFEKPWNF